MNWTIIDILAALTLITGFLYGIRRLQHPSTAFWGNRLGAISMGLAILYSIFRSGLQQDPLLWILLASGAALGLVLGHRVKMIQMPQMVALLNGLGGAASALVAGAVLLLASHNPLIVSDSATISAANSEGGYMLFVFSACLALAIGSLTFSGSMVAAAKLQAWMNQHPVLIPAHQWWMRAILLVGVLLILLAVGGLDISHLFILIVVLFGIYGFLMSLRIGGADMPIIIALLNSFSGLAASVAGWAVGSALLTGVGALVGVAGLVLTRIMCRAMNRSLTSVLAGFSTTKAPEAKNDPVHGSKYGKVGFQRTSPHDTYPSGFAEPLTDSKKTELIKRFKSAKSVVIIPGYGMAVAQAQQAVKDLAQTLEIAEKKVVIALNPLAGRMTGHMNVLLSEVATQEHLVCYTDKINPEFPETDLAVIVGANDIVNPEALYRKGTPIYGMPILRADQARYRVICNLDPSPGYSGVENPLYDDPGSQTIWGNAADTLPRITALIQQSCIPQTPPVSQGIEASSSGLDLQQKIHQILDAAIRVVIVPGYGMAVAQAQQAVKDLVAGLQSRSKEVVIAVHPVAGRMPGHMNVLLAEVGIDFEMLLEMDQVNPEFPQTDLVIVVGACDVVNPAASTAKDTPIYGMPVLNVEFARQIIVCNRDSEPGYSGVPNSLYGQPHVITLWGDAAQTLPGLTAFLQRIPE